MTTRIKLIGLFIALSLSVTYYYLIALQSWLKESQSSQTGQQPCTQ